MMLRKLLPPEKRRPLFSSLLLFSVYLAFALLMTWPLARDPGKYVISEHMDTVTGFYNLWWFHHALCVLHTSFWTSPLIDYPEGYSLIFFPVWVPYDLLALPFLHFAGTEHLPVIFNLIFLFSTAACGCAGYSLARYVSRAPAAAFAAGLALAFLPYRLWNITRWHVSCLELLAPLLYFLLRTLRSDSRYAPVGLAFFATLLVYTSPNYALDSALAALLLLAILALLEPGHIFSLAALRRLFGAACATLLLCLPFLLRVGLEVIRQPVPLTQDSSLRLTYSANLLGFVLPGFNLRAFAPFTASLALADQELARPHGIMGYEIFIGYTVLFFALAGTILRPRRALPFLLLSAFFLLLSLGPQLHLGSTTGTHPAPYQAVERLLPFLKIERTPVRHAALAFVALSVLFAQGLAAVGEKLSPRQRRLFYGGATAAVLLEFFQAPLPVTQIPIPAFVEAIRDDPSPGSVLDLPHLPLIKRFAGIHQMHHQRPLAIQLTRRVEDPAYHSSPVFLYLDQPAQWLAWEEEKRAAALAELRREFARREIRWVVVYPRFLSADDLAGLRVALERLEPEAVIRDDQYYLVYLYPAFGR